MQKYIVSEVSKTWNNGTEVVDGLISQRFEKVVNANHARGYKLADWKFNACVDSVSKTLTETIIAIFEKI